MSDSFVHQNSIGSDSMLYFKFYKTCYTTTNTLVITLPTFGLKYTYLGYPDWSDSWTPKGVIISQPGYCNYNGGTTYDLTVGILQAGMQTDNFYELTSEVQLIQDPNGYAKMYYALSATPYVDSGKLYVPIATQGQWLSGQTMAHHTQFFVY